MYQFYPSYAQPHPDGRFASPGPAVDPRMGPKTAGGCGQNWASFKYAGGPGLLSALAPNVVPQVPGVATTSVSPSRVQPVALGNVAGATSNADFQQGFIAGRQAGATAANGRQLVVQFHGQSIPAVYAQNQFQPGGFDPHDPRSSSVRPDGWQLALASNGGAYRRFVTSDGTVWWLPAPRQISVPSPPLGHSASWHSGWAVGWPSGYAGSKTAGGLGTVIAVGAGGLLTALLVGLGVATAYAIYLGDKFIRTLPSGCDLLMPGSSPNPGWTAADPSVAQNAAAAVFGADNAASIIQYLKDYGFQIQCPPGVTPAAAASAPVQTTPSTALGASVAPAPVPAQPLQTAGGAGWGWR